MKRGETDAAMTSLETVCRQSQKPGEILKAQMGLVKLYAQGDRAPEAIALCRQIAAVPHPKAQAWGQRNLAKLQQRFGRVSSPADPPADAGFVPFEETDEATSARELAFEPIEDAEPPSQPSRELAFEPTETEPTVPEAPAEAENRDRELAFDRDLAPTSTPATSEPPEPQPTSEPEIPWNQRQPQRAQTWRSLKAPPLDRLHAVEVLSAIALWIAVCLPVHGFMTATNAFFIKTNLRRPIQAFFLNHSLEIGLFLLLIAALSPWLLDGVLQLNYNSQPFSLSKLSKISPDATQSVRQFCRRHKLPIPELRLIPDDAPIILSYGHLPQYNRIALSRGLLDRLPPEDIEVLVMAQLTHLKARDLAAISGMTAFLQLLYTLYLQSSRLGDKLRDRADKETRPAIVFAWNLPIWLLAAVGSIAYGLFVLWRYPTLALSRMRQDYGDRLTVNQTGHPNGLTHSLLSLAVEMGRVTSDRPQTAYLYQSWELLAPLSHHQGRIFGRLVEKFSPETALSWDLRSPYGSWFALNQSHPLLGRRLYRLNRCAGFWELTPLLNWGEIEPAKPHRRTPGLFRLQAAPFFGLLLGLGFALVPVIAGWIDKLFEVQIVGWVYEDRWWLLTGLSMAGFAVGMLVRINPFFPDIKPSSTHRDPHWHKWLCDPQALPIDSHPVRLTGQLLGRRGMGNWLGQDLWLQIDDWQIPLHYCSKFGGLGNFLPQPVRPLEGCDRPVTVTGWFRRGATPWIDADTLKLPQGTTQAHGHPIWATIVVSLLSVWGAYIIVRGGF